MRWLNWTLAAFVLAVAAAVTNGFLAPLQVHLRVNPSNQAAPIAPPEAEAPFVGLALSGGGARAAVFAAAGMEALHERGLLEPVTHVSSVSGGGFAASYLALHPLDEETAPAAYFAQMQDVVAHNYFFDTQARQARHPRRLFSPSRRLTSLREALERPDFLAGASFANLPASRAFFFNAVSYDTGQRFVFSNSALPPPEDPREDALPSELRSLSFSKPGTLRPTPPDVPVSLAVATSAAFPPYLGPMTIRTDNAYGKAQEFHHLGDGGVVENPGVETLREALYARQGPRKGLIYSFDAGLQIDSDLSKNTHDISIWSRDFTRLVDVITTYSDTRRTLLYETLDREQGVEIELIRFDYMDVVRQTIAGTPPDPKWLSWDGWSHATAKTRAASETPAEHLAKIPTALSITPIDRELITEAARALVAKRFPLTAD